MLRGWEGNRRSGVALAVRHRLQWFVHLRAHNLPAYTPRGVWHSFAVLPASLRRSVRNYSGTGAAMLVYMAPDENPVYARATGWRELMMFDVFTSRLSLWSGCVSCSGCGSVNTHNQTASDSSDTTPADVYVISPTAPRDA